MSTQTLDAAAPAGTPAPSAVRSPPGSRRGCGRWGLRGVALLYSGLLVVLPLSAAIVAKGFGGGA